MGLKPTADCRVRDCNSWKLESDSPYAFFATSIEQNLTWLSTNFLFNTWIFEKLPIFESWILNGEFSTALPRLWKSFTSKNSPPTTPLYNILTSQENEFISIYTLRDWRQSSIIHKFKKILSSRSFVSINTFGNFNVDFHSRTFLCLCKRAQIECQ